MHDGGVKWLADEPRSVAAVYEDRAIADSYLGKRLQFAWQRLLHRRQLAILKASLRKYRPQNVLEVAPGPARLAAELDGISHGVMVENSAAMRAIARRRLQQTGRDKGWTLLQGNAFELDRIAHASAFELAYTFRLVRHFHESDRRRLYDQIRGCLAPRGLLIFDVVNAAVRQRIDARQVSPRPGEIAIYDASYDPDTFAGEMRNSGFEVLVLEPVVRHFDVQSILSHRLDDVVPLLARSAVALLELIPSSAPLEWVAICRKS
jgi:SAM-dependent methyltransferase